MDLLAVTHFPPLDCSLSAGRRGVDLSYLILTGVAKGKIVDILSLTVSLLRLMAEAAQSPLRGSAGGNRIKEGFRDGHRDGSVRGLGHRLIEKSRLAVHNPTCRDPTTGVPSLLCLTLISCAGHRLDDS
jgi:hypothetical protein